MEKNEAKQLVLDFIDCLKTFDYKRLADLFHEDFEWVIPVRSPTLEALTARRDKAYAVGRMKDNIDSMSNPLEFKPFGWTIDENRAAVECEGTVVWNNGMEYNNLYHLLFEFKDGQIVKMTEYCDFLYAWETNPLLQNLTAKVRA